jgi:hypothetical protein
MSLHRWQLWTSRQSLRPVRVDFRVKSETSNFIANEVKSDLKCQTGVREIAEPDEAKCLNHRWIFEQ